MKRSRLKRKTALKAGDVPLRRARPIRTHRLKPGVVLKPAGPRKRPVAAGSWFWRVVALYGAECVVCSTPERPVRAVQGHHAVPRQRIMADTRKPLDERRILEFDARNGVPVCAACHGAHELGATRIRRAQLPEGVRQWAREHGYGHVLKGPVYP